MTNRAVEVFPTDLGSNSVVRLRHPDVAVLLYKKNVFRLYGKQRRIIFRSVYRTVALIHDQVKDNRLTIQPA